MGKRTQPDPVGPTAQEVAQSAGVSKWTVLRAFNDGASISDGTRNKVLNVARELGYQPNLLARSLASGRSDTATLILRDSSCLSLALMANIAAEFQSQGLFANLTFVSEQTSLSQALQRAQQHRSDTACLIGMEPLAALPDLAALQSTGMRVVSIGAAPEALLPAGECVPEPELSYVGIDEAALCTAAVRELLREDR